jgi:hypothetical protein
LVFFATFVSFRFGPLGGFLSFGVSWGIVARMRYGTGNARHCCWRLWTLDGMSVVLHRLAERSNDGFPATHVISYISLMFCQPFH